MLNSQVGKLGKDVNINIKDIAKNVKIPKYRDLQVDVGHSPIIKSMKRAWNGKGVSLNQPVIRKIIATPLAGMNAALGKFTSSYYNPLSNSISIQDNSRAIAAHEFGHAEDFNSRKYPFLYGMANKLVGDIPAEAIATRKASKYLKKSDQKEAINLLSPALGSYVGAAAGVTAGTLVGKRSGIKGNALKAFKTKRKLIGTLAGVVTGHTLGRLGGTKKVLNLEDKDFKKK